MLHKKLFWHGKGKRLGENERFSFCCTRGNFNQPEHVTDSGAETEEMRECEHVSGKDGRQVGRERRINSTHLPIFLHLIHNRLDLGFLFLHTYFPFPFTQIFSPVCSFFLSFFLLRDERNGKWLFLFSLLFFCCVIYKKRLYWRTRLDDSQ